jgi:transposase
VLHDTVSVPRLSPGRPRRRPGHLIADKAYSHPSTRRALRRRGIGQHTIPERDDQIAHRHRRGRAGGRPPSFDPELYRQPTSSSAASTGSSNGAGLETQYDKCAINDRSAVLLASLIMWITA